METNKQTPKEISLEIIESVVDRFEDIAVAKAKAAHEAEELRIKKNIDALGKTSSFLEWWEHDIKPKSFVKPSGFKEWPNPNL